MKKRIFSICFLFVTLVLACGFFSSLNFANTSLAAVEGVSGNKIVLTGISGKSPQHFFTDESGQSTLVNAKTKSEKGQYYYSITSSGGQSSWGWGEYSPTPDVVALIDKGLVYAQASAQVSCNNTNVKITISAGERSQSISGSSGEIETPLLKLEAAQNIRFSFETSGSKNSFTMREPTIHLYTIISSVTLDCDSQIVTPGQMININAYNDITEIVGVSGNFVNFSKINHEINFEFVEGEEYVEIFGSSFVISKTAPDGAHIKFRAYSNKNSYSTEKIYSQNYGELTVDRENVNVFVRTDFESPAVFIGEGTYAAGKMIALDVQEIKPGFEFLGWYVDGEFSGVDPLLVSATPGQDIYAKFCKDIFVESIAIGGRVYDGTTDISSDLVSITLSGVEIGHDVYAAGFEYQYSNPNVGENKLANLVGGIGLQGENADIYNLDTTIMPPAYGTVTKRAVTVTPEKASKEYGYVDPIISFSAANTVSGESLIGSLSREEGEKLGFYPISLGDLPLRNPNYQISLAENDGFEIKPRTLTLENVVVGEKEYDGTTTAQITAQLKNIYGDEEVYVSLQGEFISANAAENVEVEITDSNLLGKDCANYVLESYDGAIFGSIKAKSATVTAISCTRVYGDETPLEYVAQGLLAGDTFEGALALSNRNVGQREIEIGTLFNPNYVISNFVSAICTVTPRPVTIFATKQSKIFGEDDPTDYEFTTQNLVYNDTFEGTLSREGGEDVGCYALLPGNLSNPNYTISFVSADFEITPREITVEVTFKDKEYDKTNAVEWTVEYKNNKTNAAFSLNIDAKLNSINCGIATLNIEGYSVECEKKDNFTFAFKFLNTSVQISQRTAILLVTNGSKFYGDDDPEFAYTVRNLVAGDKIEVEITREEGKFVGQYEFYVEQLTNSNYKVSLANAYFEILPRNIRVSVPNISKRFGDADPEIEFKVIDSFCFDDEDVVDGKIYRQEIEDVGVYDFYFDQLSSNKNYKFINAEDTHFIITKRPVTVTAHPAEKTYGQDNPKFEYTVEGDIEGQRLTVVIDADPDQNVGDHKLFCTTTDPRYSITFVEAYLHIYPSQITVKADDKTKIYGDDDPTFTVSVVDGLLMFNDRLENICQGSMIREEGENCGAYKIEQGDFSLGENYIVEFESGTLTIIKRHVRILARQDSKTYGDADPNLRYQIAGDGLALGDQISGSLMREQGENVGTYAILKGDIALNDNYDVVFVGSTFEILPRRIEIVPIDASKEYGQEDSPLRYKIIGDLVDGDVLEGQFYRDKGAEERENVGKYRIHSTLKNSNYEVVFGEHYFEILPREIVVEAESFVINYGDSEPELSYHVTSGTILDGDTFKGELFRVSGNSAGVYDIFSTLTLGKNYDVQFKKGTLTIKPLSLTIQSQNHTKTYGQADPAIDYEIVSGKLLKGDVLYGAITREQGEDVGTYNLIKGVYNANYNITFLPATLQILKKDVYLIVSVADKIYDGTTSAYITNAYVSGVSKDVYLNFDRKTSAKFVSAQVGKGIAVQLSGITLEGEGAENYNLIYPEEVFADIAVNELVGDEVRISTTDPVLEEDFDLKYQSHKVEKSLRIDQYLLTYAVDIWLEKEGTQIEANGSFKIILDVPKAISSKSNFAVFRKTKDGFEQVELTKGENGEIEVLSDGLGEFYIATEDETWLDYGAYISLAVIAATIAIIIFIAIKRKKRYKF